VGWFVDRDTYVIVGVQQGLNICFVLVVGGVL
jgi:hypothetical protein